MAQRARLLLVRLGFVVAGVLAGHVLRVFFIGLLWGIYGDGAWPGMITFVLAHLDVLLGFAGLWIGLKRVPGPGMTIYPLAVILILSYPVLQFTQMRKLHTTPEATARAHLTEDWGPHGSGLMLGKRMPPSHGQEVRFEVKSGDVDVGYLSVTPFLGFWWQIEGSSIFLPDKK